MSDDARAVVTKRRGLSMQVCVPRDWSDSRVLEFAEQENPAGTELGWQIRRQGAALLEGDDERVPCKQREGFVHIMLDV